MYQSFGSSSHDQGAARLAQLRAELAQRGLAGFLVPRADRHQGEYIPAREERLLWLTGFTGSAGLCVVARDEAALFVDGRYTVQAPEQVDGAAFAVHQIPEAKPSEWLAARAGGAIGYDPWLHTAAEVERFAKALAGTNARLEPLSDNPIDAIWPDQPPAPTGSAAVHPETLAGESSASKRARLAAALKAKGHAAAAITNPEALCWLLNIRGEDVPHTPLALGYALLRDDGSVDLFMDPQKIGMETAAHLGADVRVACAEDEDIGAAFAAALGRFGGKAVLVEKTTAPEEVSRLLQAGGAEVIWGDDPCSLPRARKNAVEIAGARAAHLRDGAAMARFLCWLDGEAPKGQITEIDAAEALEALRDDTGHLRDISFDTISAYGPHAAMPHYRVNHDSDRDIHPHGLYLIDSGGQYADGTTDITRTVAVGTPTPEQVEICTQVLRGMIAISMARFPAGTHGGHLDVLARMPLWQAGREFDHGVGHGVGSYLSVHEGPQRISKASAVPLEEGMILSNEPGYYRIGAFGVRIENLIVVTPARTPVGGDRPMHEFETLTLCPIDRRLIDPALMTGAELAWLNAYHARVAAALSPLVDDETRAWLAQACAPIAVAPMS